MAAQPHAQRAAYDCAIAVDVRQRPERAFGTIASGASLALIFETGCTDGDAAAAPLITTPAFALRHDGGFADCLQWCPSHTAFPVASGESPRRKGLLLAVLGNGSVVVWAVPPAVPDRAAAAGEGPSALFTCLRCTAMLVHSPSKKSWCRHRYLRAHAGSTMALELTPRLELTAADVAGETTTIARWSPHFPHEHVVVGTAGGTVAVFRLGGAADASEASGAVPVSVVRIAPGAVRALAWAPPGAFRGAPPADSRALFAVGAGQGFLAVFDMREPLTPAIDLATGSRSALSPCWLHSMRRSVPGCEVTEVATASSIEPWRIAPLCACVESRR